MVLSVFSCSVSKEDGIGQIIIHEGSQCTEGTEAGSALYLYNLFVMTSRKRRCRVCCTPSVRLGQIKVHRLSDSSQTIQFTVQALLRKTCH